MLKKLQKQHDENILLFCYANLDVKAVEKARQRDSNGRSPGGFKKQDHRGRERGEQEKK